MNEFFRLRKFINYQWKAKTKYYLHSPFVYQFYLNVLEGGQDEKISAIELLRKELKADNSIIQISDLGTGKASTKKISELEKNVALRKKYGEMLYRLVKYFHPQTIIELGGSIGISTSYMAVGNPGAKIITLEGSSELLNKALHNYSVLGIENIEGICGNFEDTLSQALKNVSKPDMVLFDGNHRKDATLKYFYECVPKAHENSIFIFDDIYWSPGMGEAWEEIKSHEQIKLTIDIFQYGICFFVKEKLAKENFVLRY